MTIYAFEQFQPELPEAGRYWVAPGAHVVGKVRLGLDVGIWFGAVVRGDNDMIDIGESTNIQEGAMLHADPGFPLTIGPYCTVGHHAILHGCTIGAGSLVGMGATVLNGARIGANCLIGARALITENKAFPDNSLIVGAPAKEARPLSPEALEKIKRETLAYVAKWRRFAAGMRPVGS
ncbi:MAG TPA: gamma carbonic anhydrase family protein [Candidatus Cybelea sp.]|nr:gamma carbonic anhydrase family protein [Candidatus Cybelea sp.]